MLLVEMGLQHKISIHKRFTALFSTKMEEWFLTGALLAQSLASSKSYLIIVVLYIVL